MLYKILNLKFLILLFLLLFYVLESYSQEHIIHRSDTIVIIEKNNGEEVRGILISKNDNNLIIESGNHQNIHIPNSEIKTIKYILSEEIQNKKEFENRNPNYTQYCFLPTSYTSNKNEVSVNSHYLLTYNLKYGLNDHFEVNFGGLFINAYMLGFSYSKEISDFFRIGVSTYGGFLWFIPDNPPINETGLALIPRISFGNKNKNITMGFTTGTISIDHRWIYGGYIAAQKKIKEKWTLSGELLSLTFDGNYLTYLGNITLGFMKKRNVTWNMGLAGIKFYEPYNFNNESQFIPFPYFGYLRTY